MAWKEKAIEKIKAEAEALKTLSPHGNAVSKDVCNVLITFCEQDDEFAQAIVQSGKKLKDCIESTVKGARQSISDLEVYKRAVEFYFPGATVHMNLTIDLIGEAAAPQKQSIDLSFDDLFE